MTFQGVVDSLENQLAHRTSIREKKASLQLLINIHESVRKVENLLLISSETSSSLVSKDDRYFSNSISLYTIVFSIFNSFLSITAFYFCLIF